MRRSPGTAGRGSCLRRNWPPGWGWLAGIYIALQGAGVAVFGILGRLMFSTAFGDMDDMGVSGMGGPVFGVPDGYTIIVEGQTIQSGSSGMSGIQSVMMAIPTFAMITGIVMIIGGLTLAYVLWKNGKKKD